MWTWILEMCFFSCWINHMLGSTESRSLGRKLIPNAARSPCITVHHANVCTGIVDTCTYPSFIVVASFPVVPTTMKLGYNWTSNAGHCVATILDIARQTVQWDNQADTSWRDSDAKWGESRGKWREVFRFCLRVICWHSFLEIIM